MSLEYFVDEEQDTIFIWGSGVMDRDSVMAYLQRAYNDEKLQPGMNSYVDVSHVEKNRYQHSGSTGPRRSYCRKPGQAGRRKERPGQHL